MAPMPRIPGAKIAERVRQLARAFKATRELDPRMLPILLAAVIGSFAVVLAVLWVLGSPVLGILFGLLVAVMIGLVIFGRRTQRAAIGSIEGRPGAAAAVLQTMRGSWIVTPAVAVTRKQDLVHRVIGRPGIILVGEGAPARVESLLKQEARKVARAAGDVPVHELSVGNGPGQVPLGRLQGQLTKLPRTMKAREVGPLDRKLGALSTADLPMPKGPMPRMSRKKMR